MCLFRKIIYNLKFRWKIYVIFYFKMAQNHLFDHICIGLTSFSFVLIQKKQKIKAVSFF